MRLYDLNLTGSAAAETGRSQQVPKPDEGGAPARNRTSGTGDRVEISNTLAKLSASLSADRTQRENRIAALAEAYRNGTYRPDPAGASRAMVTEAVAARSE